MTDKSYLIHTTFLSSGLPPFGSYGPVTQESVSTFIPLFLKHRHPFLATSFEVTIDGDVIMIA